MSRKTQREKRPKQQRRREKTAEQKAKREAKMAFHCDKAGVDHKMLSRYLLRKEKTTFTAVEPKKTNVRGQKRQEPIRSYRFRL